MSDEPELMVEDSPTGVRLLTLNRPERLNALSGGMSRRIETALREAEASRSIRAIVICGAGPRAFSVGADLKEPSTHAAEDVGEALGMFLPGKDILPPTFLPVIAAVHGYCVGGGWELALAADIFLCSEDASFWFPQTGLGLFPGAGGTSRLIRAIGKTNAMDIVLSGRRVSGADAVRLGFATRVYQDKTELMAGALELASAIAAKAPLGVIMAKQSLLRAVDSPLADALLEDSLRLFPLYGSRDRKEASAAFLETRKPVFEGR